MVSYSPPDPLSATFAALADPTRRAILARLSDGEVSVKELARPFDLAKTAADVDVVVHVTQLPLRSRIGVGHVEREIDGAAVGPSIEPSRRRSDCLRSTQILA